MSWCGKLRHIIGNGNCINLFADRKTLLMDLYAFVSPCRYVGARNTTVICCCQRRQTTLTLHQPHFADANRHQKMTTRTYTYFLRQSKGCVCFRTQVFFSLLLSPVVRFCSVSQVLTINETKCKFFFSLSLSLIHTYIYSIICTVSRIQTDRHLKHSS